MTSAKQDLGAHNTIHRTTYHNSTETFSTLDLFLEFENCVAATEEPNANILQRSATTLLTHMNGSCFSTTQQYEWPNKEFTYSPMLN
jgi:hypothetical protein